MATTDPAALAARFAIDGKLRFEAGPGGAPLARIESETAAASVALHGGQVLEWRPRVAAPVLWTSASAYDAPGRPVRGGVPICWPWFGPHPSGEGPAHGFARTAVWDLVEARDEGESVRLRLELPDAAGVTHGWEQRARLCVDISIGSTLAIDLSSSNPSSAPIPITQALHTYFAVGDIDQTSVLGLDGCAYIDQLDVGPDPSSPLRKTQSGEVTIDREVDRIYLDTDADCVIDDRGLGRRIRISKSGSRSTVVWNPWIEKAQRMRDFEDEEYLEMLCVETTNAADDRIELAPGATHTLGVRISLEG